jgi:asparagine synthase (glutamine-hydrolysing)
MSVNDTSMDGSQPFEHPIPHKIKAYPELRTMPKRKLMCAGEIYNYKQLIEQESFTDKDLQSSSDVEIILPMYIKYGLQDTLQKLNGDFSFVLTENVETYDLKTMNIFVVRDIIGVKPLYMVKNTKSTFYMFVSELKGVPKFILDDPEYTTVEVPPGTYWSFQNSLMDKNTLEFIRYSDWDYYKNMNHCVIKSPTPDVLASIYNNIQVKIREAIVSRYTLSKVPVGVLLSGGFDSSLVMSLLIEYLVINNHDFERCPVYAFTMGDIGNKDVECAQACVDYLEKKYNIDIRHHIVCTDEITQQQLHQMLNDVIYTLETYDKTTVRGALAYTFLFEYIKTHTNVKVLLTGEGLDEICGYEQFFHLSDEQYQSKSVKLIKNLSKFDLLRSDKMAGCYGLEVRHPYLDKQFLEYLLTIHPRLKRPQVFSYEKDAIEKYIVRKSFDVPDETEILPLSLLYRPLQEASCCFENTTTLIEDYCEHLYTDLDLFAYLNSQSIRNDNQTKPSSKEEMHYRKVFEKHYGKLQSTVPIFWTQLWD